MSEFVMFVVGIVIGWCLSCQFATPYKPEWKWEERPYSKDNKNEAEL